MPKKEKSVSDKLLDLINPTPVHFDPEADIHIETAARVADSDFDDDDFSDDGALSVFRKRNVQLIEEVDKRYAGKKVTRKSIGSFVDKAEDAQSSGDGSEDEASEDEASEGNLSEDDNSDRSPADNDESKDESDDDSGSDDSENGEDLSGVVVEDSDIEDANVSNISNDFVHLATKDTGAEIDKGKAIRTQLNLWDGLLEARISLQKVLVAANKLPQPAERPVFVSQSDGAFSVAANNTTQAVSNLLDKLIELREQRLKSFSETKGIDKGTKPQEQASGDYGEEEITSSEEEDKPKKKKQKPKEVASAANEERKPRCKRKLEDYEEALALQHSQFAAYRNETIQRWNDKTRVSTGKASSRSFSGFEQSTLKQIEQIMSNMPRLIWRTRTKRPAFRTLGKPAAVEVLPPAPTAPHGDEATPPDEAPPPADETDREVFDDGDFYHMQLRELIERKAGAAPLGRQWLAVQAARSKMKRKVDVKASKGRRLRYTPHAKLLSFMAPVAEMPCNLDARAELFASLFGAKRG